MEKAAKATQNAVRFCALLRPVAHLTRDIAKWLGASVLVCALLTLVHLLLELARLFVVGEREARHTVLQLKAVEEDTVLIVLKGVVDFLIPDNTPVCTLESCQRRFFSLTVAGGIRKCQQA